MVHPASGGLIESTPHAPAPNPLASAFSMQQLVAGIKGQDLEKGTEKGLPAKGFPDYRQYLQVLFELN